MIVPAFLAVEYSGARAPEGKKRRGASQTMEALAT
jgi:hypothetical protein